MATPLVRLASLDLIRGFVAVGRRMSVTLAAEDLCLTQSAVSRQIHALEGALGVPLFHRGYRSISFTPAGERLFRTADGVVRELQDAFETITRATEKQPVTITASIGITGQWLLPRLAELQRRHPTIDLRVAANDTVLDLRAERIDLAIRSASAADAPSGAARLFDETMLGAAAASPSAARHGADDGKPDGRAYWLVQADAAPRQDVRDVAQWILEQARSVAGRAASAAQPTRLPSAARGANDAADASLPAQGACSARGDEQAAATERIALS